MLLKKIHGSISGISTGGSWNGVWNGRETAGAKAEKLRLTCLRSMSHGVRHKLGVQALAARRASPSCRSRPRQHSCSRTSPLRTAAIGFVERAPGAAKLKSGQQKFALPSVHRQQGREFCSHERLGDLGRKKQSGRVHRWCVLHKIPREPKFKLLEL